MESDNCIFCKIVAGDLPSTKIYEDDRALAFLDIGPLVKGHTLVIPKAHYDPLTEIPDELLGHLMGVVKRVTQGLLTGLHADGVNIHQANGAAAGQVVPHLHFHVVPRFESDNHHWNWKPKSYENNDEMTVLAGRIAKATKEQARA